MRSFSGNNGLTGYGVGTEDTATTFAHVAHNVAHVVIGNDYVNVHNGLEEDGACFCTAICESEFSSGDEGDFLTINGVIFTIEYGALDVDNGVVCLDALGSSFAEALFNCGDKLTRNSTTNNCIYEFEDTVFCTGLEANGTLTELSSTTGLLLMFTFSFNHLADSFAVSDTRLTEFCFSVELILNFLADDIELHFADTGKDHFVGFSIFLEFEGAIFVHQLIKTCENFIFGVLICAGYCEADNGSGELDGCALNNCGRIAKSVVGLGIVEFCESAHIACVNGVHSILLFTTECNDRGNLFVFVFFNVENDVTVGNFTTENLEHKELTYERVNDGFEYLSNKLAVFITNEFACIGSGLDGFAGSGEDVDDVVEESGNLSVTYCNTCHNGELFCINKEALKTCFLFFCADFFTAEEFFHKFFTGLCNRLE